MKHIIIPGGHVEFSISTITNLEMYNLLSICAKLASNLFNGYKEKDKKKS